MGTEIAALNIKVESSQTKKAQSDLLGLEQAGGAAAKSMGGLTATATKLAGALVALSAANNVKGSILDAARFETMGIVMKTVGNAAGYTSAQMDQFAQSLQKQGISMLGAEESLARMVQGNIDLSQGVRLATAAQGAAILMDRTSTEAFETMTTAIATGLAVNLHRLGIMVDFEHAYDREAAALHKSKEELSEREKVQARVNETLTKTNTLEDVYAAAMGTAGKQLGTMARYLSDLSVMVGSVGLDTLTVAVFGTADALKTTNAYLKALMQDGTIQAVSKSIADGFTEAWKAVKLATEVLGLFWLSWRSTVAVETAMLTLGLLKLELRALAVEIAAAGGAWNYFTGAIASSLPMLTTVGGVFTGIASALSGMLIGKYLADNFKWAAEATLSMGETILSVWARIIGTYKIGVASLSGNQETAEQELSAKLLTIRMTYLHERAELDKKFATPEQKAKTTEVLGAPSDQKALQSVDKINAAARKVEEARKTLAEAMWGRKIATAEREGQDQYYVKSLEAEKEHADKVAEIRKRLVGANAEKGILNAALDEENARFATVMGNISREGEAQRALTQASIDQTVAENMGLSAYQQQVEAIKAKYRLVLQTKAATVEGQNAERMQAAELQKLADARALAARNDRVELAGINHDLQAGLQAQKEMLLVELDRTDSAERRALIEKKLADVEAHMKGDQWYAAKDALSKYASDASDKFANMTTFATSFATKTEDALVKAFTGSKDAFKDFANGVLQDLIRMQVRASITGPLFSIISGGSGSGLFGALASGVKRLFSANGNAFAGSGPVATFASGGAFGNGEVLTSPTAFRFASGGEFRTGVAGEAGPEGALPLKRMSSGKLGVYADGGGSSSSSPITVKLINQSGQQIKASSAKASQDSTGTLITVMIDALQRNVGGFRDSVQAAVGA